LPVVMAPIDRSDDNDQLIALRDPLRRHIVREPADVEEGQLSNLSLGRGSDDGGTGRVPATPLLEHGRGL